MKCTHGKPFWYICSSIYLMPSILCGFSASHQRYKINQGSKCVQACSTWMPMHICREQGHKSSCVQNHMQVFKWWSTFRFVHHVMVKCSSTVEEPTASVFTVVNVVKVDGEVIQGKNCDTQSNFRVSDRSHLQKAVPSQWELRFPRMALFSGFTNGINRNVLFRSIHYLDLLCHPCLK